MSTFSYPVTNGAPDWSPPARVAALNLAMRHISLLARKKADEVQIRRADPAPLRPLSDDDFPLIVLTHNDMRFMPSFFAHYRAMGVTRFFCMDDQSSDGTPDFILAQPDADLFTSNVRYKDARQGRVWREKLLGLLGTDRWYLNVDSDEYFLYESMPRETIAEFTKRLDAVRVKRLPAAMLDLYPVGDVSEAVFSGEDATMPWDIATHFDGDGYTGQRFNTGISIYGGVRARALNAEGELIKYPLIRWDRYCWLGRTIHRPKPSLYNFATAMGALLHFKIFSDVRERMEMAVVEGQHYMHAKNYQLALNNLRASDAIDLSYRGSIPYAGVDDLVRRGFMLPLAAGRG